MSLHAAIAALLITLSLAAVGSAQTNPPRNIDARRVTAAGIRILPGRHIQILTDLSSSPAVDQLPQVFDAAITEWSAYFGLESSQVGGKYLAFVIQDRDRFAALDLLPDDNPQFVNGYARDYELWLMDQPSDYYRRHLLLHEGTHAFMQTQLGGGGPGWYMEGMAELLGTHTWHNGKLTLGVMPASRGEVPMWGRIKLIREAAITGKAWPIDAVLEVDNRRVLTTDQYAWTWALAKLLDTHPAFRDRFRALKSSVANPQFSKQFRTVFASDWSDLLVEWNAFIAELDYGHDIERTAIVHRPAEPVGIASNLISIAANRGWQSTGWLLQAGVAYRVSASGRVRIARDEGKPWPCEPNGVTLEYHDGRPLGILLGALRPVEGATGAFATPIPIGGVSTVRSAKDAVLYLRVNDSPAKLADNDGDFDIRVESAPSR